MLSFDRITFDPQVLIGRACIRGMRISFSLILNLFESGLTAAQIIKAYPYLDQEDLNPALHWAKANNLFPGTSLTKFIAHPSHSDL
jgi:uncharacterized protein (DUF433 family)